MTTDVKASVTTDMKTETAVELIRNLKARNITAVEVASAEEARSWALGRIPPDATVGFGNSQTVKALGLAGLLRERGNVVYDKTAAGGREEAERLKREALLADWFVAGVNAVSFGGEIVNIDHSGNRVAGMLYGPRRVLLLAGRNKLAPTLEEAVRRAREVAAPQNARRAGLSPTCVALGRCVDCRSQDRVCNSLVIIEGQADPERMTLLLVDDELGF